MKFRTSLLLVIVELLLLCMIATAVSQQMIPSKQQRQQQQQRLGQEREPVTSLSVPLDTQEVGDHRAMTNNVFQKALQEPSAFWTVVECADEEGRQEWYENNAPTLSVVDFAFEMETNVENNGSEDRVKDVVARIVERNLLAKLAQEQCNSNNDGRKLLRYDDRRTQVLLVQLTAEHLDRCQVECDILNVEESKSCAECSSEVTVQYNPTGASSDPDTVRNNIIGTIKSSMEQEEMLDVVNSNQDLPEGVRVTRLALVEVDAVGGTDVSNEEDDTGTTDRDPSDVVVNNGLEQDFASARGGEELTAGEKASVAIGVSAAALLMAFFLWWCCCKRKRNTTSTTSELKDEDDDTDGEDDDEDGDDAVVLGMSDADRAALDAAAAAAAAADASKLQSQLDVHTCASTTCLACKRSPGTTFVSAPPQQQQQHTCIPMTDNETVDGDATTLEDLQEIADDEPKLEEHKKKKKKKNWLFGTKQVEEMEPTSSIEVEDDRVQVNVVDVTPTPDDPEEVPRPDAPDDPEEDEAFEVDLEQVVMLDQPEQ